MRVFISCLSNKLVKIGLKLRPKVGLGPNKDTKLGAIYLADFF